MEPGRVLDALVAEKVMGQPVEWVEVLDYQGRRKEPYLCESNEGHGCSDEVEPYSTSIGAAWEVVRSRPLGTWNWNVSQCDDGRWFAEVRIGYRTSYDKAFPQWAETPEMAICLAALEAVGMEVL